MGSPSVTSAGISNMDPCPHTVMALNGLINPRLSSFILFGTKSRVSCGCYAIMGWYVQPSNRKCGFRAVT